MQMKTELVENAVGQHLFRVEMRDEKGAVISKVISLEDYLSMLETSLKLDVKEDVIRIPKGAIPKGYIDGKFSRSGYTVIWREPAKKRLFIHKTGHYQIPFPDLVFCLCVENGRMEQKQVFAASKDTLYRYPFGNVDEDGHICMGNIRVDLESIGDFSEAFFLSETNEDYYTPKESIRQNWTQGKLLAELSKKDAFPIRWLNQAPYKTVQELLESVMREVD